VTSRTSVAAVVALAAAFAAARAGDDAASRKTAVVELGRRLFVDPTAGRSGRTSCASCHDPDHGFSDTSAASFDEFGDGSRRRAPTLVDLGAGPFGWDGEFDTLREAVADEIVDPAHRRDARAGRAVRRVAAAKKAGVAVD